jgi:hypothetical protein
MCRGDEPKGSFVFHSISRGCISEVQGILKECVHLTSVTPGEVNVKKKVKLSL